MNRVQNSMLMLIAFSMFALLAVNLTAQEASPQPKEVFAHYYSPENQLGLEWIISERSEVIKVFSCTIQQIEADSTLSFVSNFQFSIYDENLNYKGDDNGLFYYSYFNSNIVLEPGMYELTLTSISQYGESLPSLSTYFWYDKGENKDEIIFTELPEMYATVGKLYQSKIKAESYYKDITIKYSLTEAPQGMTIDENSGLIKFTPTEGGYPYFVVRATNADDASEYAEIYLGLIIANCENLATITGKINYDASVENKNGYVLAYQIAADGTVFQAGYADVYEQGDFNIQLDKGSYYIYFMLYDKYGENDFYNVGEWYKDAITMEQAEVITVDCGENV
ncbi:MAG: putative Ig domain-containing protein, partial [Melioribacteraceae bacterium]